MNKIYENMYNPNLTGYEKLEERLFNLYNKGTVPHAILLSGNKGTGKTTFAYRFARFLFSKQMKDSGNDMLADIAVAGKPLQLSQDHPIFEKQSVGGITDLFTIKREISPTTKKLSQFITVDSVKAVSSQLYKTSSEGGWRVVIIQELEKMNKNSANALLKILEEPPAKVVFLLVCNNTREVLDTIKSRSIEFKCPAISKEDFEGILRNYFNELISSDITRLYSLTNGSVGKAIQYYKSDIIEFCNKLDTALFEFSKGKKSLFTKMVGKISKDEILLEAFINYFFTVAYDTVSVVNLNKQLLMFSIVSEDYQKIIESLSSNLDAHKVDDLLEVVSKYQKQFKMVQVINLEKTSTIINFVQEVFNVCR